LIAPTPADFNSGISTPSPGAGVEFLRQVIGLDQLAISLFNSGITRAKNEAKAQINPSRAVFSWSTRI
jgi:hypothetical protein